MILELCVMAGVQLGVHYLRKRRRPSPVPPAPSIDAEDVLDDEDEQPPAPEAPPVAERGVGFSVASLALAVATRGTPLGLISTGIISYSVAPVYEKALARWREDRRITNDTLFSLFSGLALLVRYNTAIAFGYVAYELGSHLLRKTSAETEQMTTDVFNQLPRTIWVVQDGVEIELPIAEAQVGDTVVVRSGEIVPIDGQIVDGHAQVDQHMLTGEAQPAEKQPGDTVLASTLLTSGRILVRVERAGEETNVAQIVQTLLDISHAKTEAQSRGERLADQIALPTLALSGAAFVVGGLPMAIVMLNSSFGNRIRVLGPLSTLNYLTIAARNGILVKSGTVLEQVNQIDTVLFDKTGTLTLPELRAGTVNAYGGFGEDEILVWAAAAEHRQTHPIAKAILRAAEERELTVPQCDDADYTIGYGVTVDLPDGGRIRVGSMRFMDLEGITATDALREDVARSLDDGVSLVVVAKDDEVAGTIHLEPEIRPEVPGIIASLREQGVEHMAIVSGDHRGPTRALADRLGIAECFAEVLPTEKADIVRHFQDRGRTVCFIGDGVNDSVAMQQADVSISLAGASTIATDSASIILMSGKLDHLGELFDIAERLDANVRRSLGVLIGSAALNVGGAVVFGLGVGGSVLLKAASSFAAVGNSTLPLLEQRKNRHAEPGDSAT